MRDLDPYLAGNSPVLEAEEEEVSSAAMMESDGDLPGQDESESLGSDTDLDDLADALKQSDVEHFASMLQEAQRIAVEIKRHEVEQKRKMLKTYQGNSKKTLYHCEHTWETLASKGFLDIATFMALKWVQVQGANESMNSDMLEVDAGMHKLRRAIAPLCPPGIQTLLALLGIGNLVEEKWRRRRRRLLKVHLHVPMCSKLSSMVAPLCPLGLQGLPIFLVTGELEKIKFRRRRRRRRTPSMTHLHAPMCLKSSSAVAPLGPLGLQGLPAFPFARKLLEIKFRRMRGMTTTTTHLHSSWKRVPTHSKLSGMVAPLCCPGLRDLLAFLTVCE